MGMISNGIHLIEKRAQYYHWASPTSFPILVQDTGYPHITRWMACVGCFRGFSPWLTGWEAEKAWWKDPVEENCSPNGGQKREKKRKRGDRQTKTERKRETGCKNMPFQATPPETHLFWSSPHLLTTQAAIKRSVDQSTAMYTILMVHSTSKSTPFKHVRFLGDI